jgi:lysophospholipase L1-like esterase
MSTSPIAATAERADPHVIGTERARDILAAAPWTRVAALGDSLVAGAGDAVQGYAPTYWVDRVVGHLRSAQPGLLYVNEGERDQRLRRVIEHQLPRVLAFGPDLVIADGGGNDLFVEHHDAGRATARYEHLIDSLLVTGATVVTFTMFGMPRDLSFPEPFGSRLATRMGHWQQVVRDVAHARGTILIDFEHHPLAGDPRLYSDDMVHLNARGHAVAASCAVEALAAHLSGTP